MGPPGTEMGHDIRRGGAHVLGGNKPTNVQAKGCSRHRLGSGMKVDQVMGVDIHCLPW